MERSTFDRRQFLKKMSITALAVPGAAQLLAACAPSEDGGSGQPTAGPTSTGTGSGGAVAGPPASPTGLLVVANNGEPNFIDPAQALQLSEWVVVRNVYDSLVQWNDDYTELIPALAESWESNDDETEWTFRLRQGVTFHDGAVFDSTAARKTIEYYLDKTWGLVWAGLADIDDSDPNVLRVLFDQPSPDLARNNTLAQMLSPNLVDDDAASETAVGTGPFKFVEWRKGDAIELEANPDYWDDGPYLQGIRLNSVADETSRVTALKAGDVDLVFKVSPRQLQDLAADDRFTVSSKDSWIEGHVAFRCDQAPTDDVRVRQAVAHAIDRDGLMSTVFLGQGVVANTPLPPGTYGYAPASGYDYDPERAKALLAEAGLEQPVRVGLNVFAGTTTLAEEVGQAIAGMMSQAGFEVAVDINEAGVAIADLTAEEPRNAVHLVEHGYPSGGPFHFTVGTILGQPQYTGEELSAAMAEVATTPSGDERLALLERVQELFMEELPHLPLYHLTLSDVFRSDLQGYTNPKEGYLPVFQKAYLAE